VALALPVRVFGTSIRYLDRAGSNVELTGPNILAGFAVVSRCRRIETNFARHVSHG